MTPALRVENLTITYSNGHVALDRLNLDLPLGGSLGVVGSSGCGKTTLIRAILGLLPARTRVEGRIHVGEQDLFALSARQRRELLGVGIGYVAQDPFAACDPLRRVHHHVAEAWRSHGQRPPDGAVLAGLAAVGIPEPERRSSQYPHQWSGGMLQRATTLAATVHRPLLTLADEPTSALDADLADGALDLLRRTCQSLLLVSHDLALVSRHTDRIVVLSDGHIVEDGNAHSVLCSPRHEVTRALVRASVTQPMHEHPLAPNAPYVARVHEVSRAYPHTTAVDRVCLSIRAGEVVGIVGASGSGKSTLLRLVAGMERPDSGDVLLGETPLWGKAPRPRAGYVMPVFQDPVGSLDPRWSLWRSITEPLVLGGRRMTRAERRERARAALTEVGLAGIDVNRIPGSLSVGQSQRVAIVRALIAGPALIVADEPTASLDVDAATTVAALFRTAADRGIAVLVVSHDEPRLSSFADRIVRMRDGRFVT